MSTSIRARRTFFCGLAASFGSGSSAFETDVLRAGLDAGAGCAFPGGPRLDGSDDGVLDPPGGPRLGPEGPLDGGGPPEGPPGEG